MGIDEYERAIETIDLIFYSQEIAWLGRLLRHKQINETEYQKIKGKIMRAHHVQSDLTAMIDTR